jgi:ACS family tartrate transporter-like MFS transporter
MNARSAGTAIALINSIGAIGAFCGPSIMGWLHDATHAYTAGLFCIAGLVAAAGILASGKTEISA